VSTLKAELEVIGALSSFEEGMTRAAEVEVLNRITEISSNDKNHSYTVDTYYDALNKQSIGGNIFLGYISPFFMYQTSGYAWGKILIENENFFVDFNNQYYEACKNDTDTKSNVEKMLTIAEEVQPIVESSPFRIWYERQASLNLNPRDGKYIFQRINQFTTDFFERSDGIVKMIHGQDIDCSVYDYKNNLLVKNKYTTNSVGIIDSYPFAH